METELEKRNAFFHELKVENGISDEDHLFVVEDVRVLCCDGPPLQEDRKWEKDAQRGDLISQHGGCRAFPHLKKDNSE